MNSIVIVGKNNHIPWAFYTFRGFVQNDFDVDLFYYNDYSLSSRIKKVFSNNEKVEYDRFYNFLKEKKRSVVVFVSAFFIPQIYFEVAKELNIMTIAWVGDSFSLDKKKYLELIDKLYLFDSSLVTLSKSLGFNSELLQVGFDIELHRDFSNSRTNTINFIGSHTKERENILNSINGIDLKLYGLKWNKLAVKNKYKYIDNTRIDYKKVIEIYNSNLFSLNISQVENVSDGVNMRIFETVACGSCLITDYVKDLELCFEPNKEILVYNNIEELQTIINKIQMDKSFYHNIIKNAHDRLQKSNYTYKERTKYMIDNLGE